MKKNIIILIIYLLGCFCTYPFAKWTVHQQKADHVWTVGDRNCNICFSSLSWLAFTLTGMSVIFDFDNTTPAKW